MQQRLPELTAKMLHPQAYGRWLDIFQYLCPGMFDEAIANIGQHVTCPFHGGSEDFRFAKRRSKKGGNTAETGVAMCTCGVFADGFAVLHKAMGGRFIDVLKEVDRYLNGTTTAAPAPIKKFVPPVKTVTSEEQAVKDAETLAKSINLFNSGLPLNLDEWPYYQERGIDPRILDNLQDVRVLPSLAYWHKVDGKLTKLGSYPALLVLMRNAKGDPVAVHRTWLSADRKGKAPVPKAKKLSESPDVTGAAMRVFVDAHGQTDTLGLTEGVETAFGVRQLLTGGFFEGFGPFPVWPCFAERNIRNFVVPESLLPTLTRIVVFADNDERGTGLAAAMDFKARMAIEHPHLIVDIKVPDTVGHDWLDVLVNL